jgi:hypothetical protein
MKRVLFAANCALLVFFAGCSEAPPVKKEAAKPPEPVTGRFALYEMYRPARMWASDVEILRLSSMDLAEVKSTPGKAGAWQATFVSPSKGRARTWTYSTVESEGNLHKGPFAGLEEGWSGSSGGVNQTFPIIAVHSDTDEAYKTAAEKAGDYAKKNPNKKLIYLLERTTRHRDPTWRVLWGDSVATSDFSVFVDASTGTYAETMR